MLKLGAGTKEVCQITNLTEPNAVEDINTIPKGRLGIIAMAGCEDLAKKISSYLTEFRTIRNSKHMNDIAFVGYVRDNYIIDSCCSRFSTGEAKGLIKETVRGCDLFIICDCFNYGVKYRMYGEWHRMSPDDHFADLKRIIDAAGGKARRITVIMPMLYCGRQHKRSARESLDSAMCLHELASMGVENIITFDAHDPRVQNAIPLAGFENVQPYYQMIKAMVNNIPDLSLDREHIMVISPDEGAMTRNIYYSTVLNINLGMFYKRRDYSRIVNGRNPIVAHEYLGEDVSGKDVIIADDMISSGESVLSIAKKLKEMNARRIFFLAAFGLFSNGLEAFDKAFEQGLFDMAFTTNLVYRQPELKTRDWYVEVDMSKYMSFIVDRINHDVSISSILDPKKKIESFLVRKGLRTQNEIDAANESDQ
ncbi:MAG: ribose-phosphate pyrophosphokinase [Clostridia bacterium]|nr:ribose-phosphate pyrophosphokinase [Clostridia bacterium]